MSNRNIVCQIHDRKYLGFFPARLTDENALKWVRKEWHKSVPSLEAAREVLKETDCETAIAFLVDLLNDEDVSDNYDEEIALLLGQVDVGNETAIAFLLWKNQRATFSEDFEETANKLHRIDPSNETAISFFLEIIQSEQINEDSLVKTAKILAKFDSGNQTAIASLVKVLQNAQDEYSRFVLAYSLGQFDPSNEAVINTFVKIIHTNHEKYLRCQALLLNLLEDSIDITELCEFGERCIAAAHSLGRSDPGNEIAISTLIELIHPTQDEYIENDLIRVKAAHSLGIINPGNEIAISTLVDVIQTQELEDIVSEALESLKAIGTGNEIAIAALERLIQSRDYDSLIAESLGIIDPGNETAITALVELILDEDSEAANSLERILQRNQYPKVVKALKHYMTERVYKDEFYFACHDVLWRCAQNMSYPDFYRAWHSEPSLF